MLSETPCTVKAFGIHNSVCFLHLIWRKLAILPDSTLSLLISTCNLWMLLFVFLGVELKFTIEPQDVVAVAGRSVVLDCAAHVSDAALVPKVKWRTVDSQDLTFIGDPHRSVAYCTSDHNIPVSMPGYTFLLPMGLIPNNLYSKSLYTTKIYLFLEWIMWNSNKSRG